MNSCNSSPLRFWMSSPFIYWSAPASYVWLFGCLMYKWNTTILRLWHCSFSHVPKKSLCEIFHSAFCVYLMALLLHIFRLIYSSYSAFGAYESRTFSVSTWYIYITSTTCFVPLVQVLDKKAWFEKPLFILDSKIWTILQ